MDDTAVALPPLDDVLARDLIARTRIGRLLAGFRDRRPSDQAAIAAALNGLSQMIVDFPCIVAIDINPLLADDEGVIALDARIEIEPETIDAPGPNPALAIRPYPAEWDRRITLAGTEYRLRPIKPVDIALYPDFLAKVSPGDVQAPLPRAAQGLPRRHAQATDAARLRPRHGLRGAGRPDRGAGWDRPPLQRPRSNRRGVWPLGSDATCKATVLAGRCSSRSLISPARRASDASKASSSPRTIGC